VKYETPFITDYGDVREITAARSFRTLPDAEAPSEDTNGVPPGSIGIDDTTGPCRTDLGPLPPIVCGAQSP
jgi:hypothetical protein